MKRIIVNGIHRKTGNIAKYWWDATLKAGWERAYRKAQALESLGYFVVVNDPYGEQRELRNGGLSTCDNECGFDIAGGVNVGDPLVKYPYKVHSVNTVNQRGQGSHVGFVETLNEAEGRAAGCVKTWASDHPGAVIFKAIKLVRMRPRMSPIEFVDL